ncbi:MAG: DUF1841 family protein [Ottowia sp.]|nr:DUF1841 family protein [Ottowia sp.]
MLFNPSREEVRQFFCTIWDKHAARQLLSPLESMALEWVLIHPEYHALLSNQERALAQDFTPEDGQTNPFLHLAMHLSIAEQISIDQPAGIRQAYEQLCQKLDSKHEAHHRIMTCLGEMLWQAQRNNQAPDGAAYIRCIQSQTQKLKT